KAIVEEPTPPVMVWTIPEAHKREKANGGKLPLPRMALEVIEGLPKIQGNRFVFASNRTDHHINSFPKDKKELDRRLKEALGRDVDPWVLHSLRHTAKTLMASAGVPEFNSERLLGHVVPGI
ncbi:MAG: tyrosine-type recombinase/integrase, partial [Anaerolineae bacterium]|nr:tyrosine-type recombinase/integrase [Anaerolineae bacterium]